MKRMLSRMREIHEHFGFKDNGGEEIEFRMLLLMEEVGEICEAITKKRGDIVEEHADLLIVLLGNCISLGIDIEDIFWKKTEKMLSYKSYNNGKNSRIISKERNDE